MSPVVNLIPVSVIYLVSTESLWSLCIVVRGRLSMSSSGGSNSVDDSSSGPIGSSGFLRYPGIGLALSQSCLSV